MSGWARFSLPLADPLETAAGPITERTGYLIRLGDDPIGIGEATPLAGWTEPLDDAQDAIAHGLAEVEQAGTAAAVPPMAETPAARHGLELAVIDRAARREQVPLYRSLGADRRVSTVPVNATVGDGAIEATVDASRAAASAGFPAIKVKVGARSVADDIDRVAAVRDVIGADIELRVDANGAWSREAAATALEELDAVGVSLVEQPLDPADLAGHADLRGRAVDIALDEALAHHDLEAVLEAQAADVLILKPMVLGGIDRARNLAEQARAAGVDVIVTTTMDAAVARTAAVHLAGALDIERPCGLATADRFVHDIGADPAPVVDGAISVPQGAGHGVGVEELE